MKLKLSNEQILEICLIIVILGLSSLMINIGSFKMVVLNLFFLPVLLGAFFLGRYRAGVMALLSFVMVTIVAAQDFDQFAAFTSPITTALAITIWGAVLGLTTIIAGTLSDERTTQMNELHAAYIGVIEVLSNYLHGAHPNLKDRPLRIADLSQRIATRIRLSPREIDDIRVASLLQEMDHIQITTRALRKLAGTPDDDSGGSVECTFNGADLVQSLGGVINGALPLLCRYDDDIARTATDETSGGSQPPLGAHIISTARLYDRLVYGKSSSIAHDPVTVLAELQAGLHGVQHPAVLRALEQVALQPQTSRSQSRQRLGTTSPG